MRGMEERKACDRTFSLGEKLLLRTTFVLSILSGAFGIWLTSPAVAVAYLAFAAVSYFLLMRYSVCARCPHLFEADDCLFLPAFLVRKFVARREGQLSWWERLILDSAVIGTAVIPVFWLYSIPWLLLYYVAVTVGFGYVLIRFVCARKCEVDVCPLNKRFRSR